MPNNEYMYFHLTRSPSEPMSVQLLTLQMHNKIIYMILCQSKGLWLKKNGNRLKSSFVSAMLLLWGWETAAMIGVKQLWDLMPYLLVTFVFAPFYRSPFFVE